MTRKHDIRDFAPEGQQIYDFIDFIFSQLICFDVICIKFRLFIISKSGHFVQFILQISFLKFNLIFIKCLKSRGRDNKINFSPFSSTNHRSLKITFYCWYVKLNQVLNYLWRQKELLKVPCHEYLWPIAATKKCQILLVVTFVLD